MKTFKEFMSEKELIHKEELEGILDNLDKDSLLYTSMKKTLTGKVLSDEDIKNLEVILDSLDKESKLFDALKYRIDVAKRIKEKPSKVNEEKEHTKLS